jgi:tRNA A37 N6-isopentenylltransferase MiaA
VPKLNPIIFLRYNTIIFWLYTDPVTLNKRLDDRVMKMIEVNMKLVELGS